MREIHKRDSSMYFYKEGYLDRLDKGEQQRQLSKEFVRLWLIEKGFPGKEGQSIPEMDTAFVTSVSERYIELYEKITGEPFEKASAADVKARIEKNVLSYLNNL